MRTVWRAAALVPVLAILALAVPAWGDTLETEAKAIEAALVAPCCWSQQVSLHQSQAAEEIKREIRVALASGRTRQQIVDGYVERYGTRILIEPPARGFAAWLYVLPVIAFVVSAGGLAFVLKRFAARGRAPAATPADERAGARDANRELDEQLRDLD